MKQIKSTETICAYCESVCDSDIVHLNNQHYCCYGCATLSDVVARMKHAPVDIALKYKQLDLPESFNELVDYQNDKLYKIAISLPAIHCSSCIELLEDLPSFMNGVLSCHVNFEQRRCTVSIRKNVPLSAVAQLLDDIGYPPQISVSQKRNDAEKAINRTNLLKLALAGFCFGNIMLFSLPHYFGLGVTNQLFFTRLFSVLSMVLSLPVVAYAGRDYLTSAYKALSAGKLHINVPIAIGILSLFGWSFYEILSGAGIGYLDSLAGLIFFLLIGKWFQHKVYDHVSYHRNVQDFIPLVVRKLVHQQEEWVRIDSLEKGDIVRVKNEEIIPVNGILLKGIGRVDYAFITGESVPEPVQHLGAVYAGGCQESGELDIQLSEKPSIEKLWSTWSTNSEVKEFRNSWLDAISHYFTLGVLAIALVAGAVWGFIDMSRAIFVFSAVLIVACPCALALSAPFTYGNILRVFSKNNFFLKNANAIFTLGEIQHIVLDKTGTMTEKEALLVSFEGGELTAMDKQLIAAVTNQSTHPLSSIITHYLKGVDFLPTLHFKEEQGKGVEATVGGKFIKIGSSSWLNAADTSKATSVYVSIDEELIGHFRIQAKYRTGLETILNRLSTMVSLSVLSGDTDGEKSALHHLFPGFKMLKFKLKPAQKAQLISELQTQEKVMMIGDGLNDSAAIQRGDMGVALTENLNGFYPGSDAVLLSDSFEQLPEMVALAKYAKKIVRWSFLFSLMYNVTGVGFAVLGLLTPVIAAILMPLSSISVVLLVTVLVRLKSQKLNLI